MSDDYARMSHQELFNLAHTGDPGRLFSAGDHWHRVSSDMNDLHADLTKALGELAEQWQGAASADFQQQGAMIAGKINQAATRSQAMGDGLHQMGQALGDARARMPEPPSGLELAADKLVGGSTKGGIVGELAGGPIGLIAGALGGKALDDHIKSQHSDAVRVMQNLGNQYNEASKKFDAGEDGQQHETRTHNLPLEPGSPPSTGTSAGSSQGAGGYSRYHGGSRSGGYQPDGSTERYADGTGVHLAHEGYQPPNIGLPGGPTPPPGESGGGHPSPPGGGTYPLPPGGGFYPPGGGGESPPGGGRPGPGRGGFSGDGPSSPGRGSGGGLGGLDEGISGGRVSSGGSASRVGSEGISGGQPTGRMSAANPNEAHGLGGNPAGSPPAGGGPEGEQGMPMAPGGMGGAGGGESKRGKRPAYLTEDPATWDVIGPHNPAVIE